MLDAHEALFAADVHEKLLEPKRLRALDEILLARSRGEIEFDRLTRVGAKTLNVPICLVTLVGRDRQILPGASGLPASLDATREVPLSHSVCKYAVVTRNPLTIKDTAQDPRVADSPVVLDLGLRAYLGFPLMTEEGHVLGTFCAIDTVPREWSSEEIEIARDFAALAVEQLECALARERSSSAFDVVIHDIQSPLAGVVMATELMEKERQEIPKRLHPLLRAIGDSSDKALRLVRSLVQDDRGAGARFCEQPAEVVRAVSRRLQSAAHAKDIAVALELEDAVALAVPAWVLEQVVENLLSNAIKFAPAQSLVCLGFRVAEGAGHLHIRDQGPGFNAEDRKRMFKRYTRLSASPTASEPSTGLGLSIVKRLVGQNGGEISLLSSENQGAEFQISFPLASAPPQLAAASAGLLAGSL